MRCVGCWLGALRLEWLYRAWRRRTARIELTWREPGEWRARTILHYRFDSECWMEKDAGYYPTRERAQQMAQHRLEWLLDPRRSPVPPPASDLVYDSEGWSVT